jgi:hypothetical protein
MLYGTTRMFLEYFELRDLESLPTLEEITDLGENLDEGIWGKREDWEGEPEGESGRMGEGEKDAETRGHGDEEEADFPKEDI